MVCRLAGHVGKHGNFLANALLAGCIFGVAWSQLQQKYNYEREVAQRDEQLSIALSEKQRWGTSPGVRRLGLNRTHGAAGLSGHQKSKLHRSAARMHRAHACRRRPPLRPRMQRVRALLSNFSERTLCVHIWLTDQSLWGACRLQHCA